MSRIPPPRKAETAKRNATATSIPDQSAPSSFRYLGDCARCGKRFVKGRADQLYCSDGPGSCKRLAAIEARRAKVKAKRKSNSRLEHFNNAPRKRCRNCTGWFWLIRVEGTIATRSDRKYCTGECRQAAYRNRKKQLAAIARKRGEEAATASRNARGE